MIIIPGFLISILTFPGVIVHEAAHMLFCRIFGLAVFDVCFFRIGNPAGYVVHEETDKFSYSFFVGMGPFFLNTILCLLFCLPAFPVAQLDVKDPAALFFYWLGLSIGMHAIPSTQDLSNIHRLAGPAARGGNIFAILAYPLIGLLYLANVLRFFWIDYGYGMLIGVVLPWAVFRWMV